MELLGQSLITNVLVACFLLLLSFFYWINRRQDYFKNLNIPFVPSTPLIGVFKDVLLGRTGIYEQVAALYNQSEVKDKPFFGVFMFHKPCLMISEPELVKRIFVKDFASFTDRYSGSDDHDPLGSLNMFTVKSPRWKHIRGKMTPFFSSGKLKTMYYLLDKINDNVLEFISKSVDKNEEIELKELASLYTTDVIASCAYGVDANSIANPNGGFRKAGVAMFGKSFKRQFELPALFMLPQAMKLFRFKAFSTFGSKFIEETVTEVMEEREKSGQRRNDLIDTLIELKNSGDDLFSMDVLMAQAAIFFVAGFETSSATQSFALYHIGMDKGIQDKLRGEIKEMLARTEGKVTYDSVMNLTELPYLHQILNETLRIYPIIPILDRICVNPEGFSLQPFSDFTVPFGMPIYIPAYGIQLDEKNFPDAKKFDPERFSPENMDDIKPFTYFPFGTGPRNCIGERFGLMQVKTGIVKILKDFRLEQTENTPQTIVFDKTSMVAKHDKGLFFKMVKDPLY